MQYVPRFPSKRQNKLSQYRGPNVNDTIPVMCSSVSLLGVPLAISEIALIQAFQLCSVNSLLSKHSHYELADLGQIRSDIAPCAPW